MQVSYIVVVSIVAYIMGAILKTFIDKIPKKFIPLEHVVIAIISAFACYFFKVEESLLQAIVLCFVATMGANGFDNLVTTMKNKDEIVEKKE